MQFVRKPILQKKELLWALMLESMELKDEKMLLNKKAVVGWYDDV